MKVFVTGATGFVGQALVRRLRAEGHAVSVLVRDPARARAQLGADVTLCAIDATDGAALARHLSEVDAVVNLAGESLMTRRWSAARKQALWSSRVELTATLVHAIAAAEPRPRTLVSASAVGVYGDRGDEALTEDSALGSGFLAALCRAWESAAQAAVPLGVRLVSPRIGIVLGGAGGALAAMQPAFRLGVGGPLGSGAQYVSFIHLDDLLSVLLGALVDPRMHGPLNATAPTPVTFRQLAHALGAALSRPAALPVPAWALRLGLGERADALLQSQNALPARLQSLGFAFAHPTLESALGALYA